MGFVGPARVGGNHVAVKQYRRHGVVDFRRRETLLQLKQLKELQHDYLTTFHGLCVDRTNRLLVVWDLCGKGSLADVLYNNEVELDETFRSSILRDITPGLHYLHHSTVGVHGSLTSENCVVDRRWTVRLTDFALSDILWSARNKRLVTLKPFSATKILSQLINGSMMEYRPAVGTRLPPEADRSGELGRVLLSLMQRCWDGAPDDRPPIDRIRKIVTSLSATRTNIVEHMMAVMERYATNLEHMVASRTKQVQEEKTKADKLLARMLPQSVAEDLKRGVDVPPETFETVTIYFSDIVGFTAIAGRSTPLQVVGLLNLVYGTLDRIMDNYDAYKVETIGDAYMVASGIPTRNGYQHVVQIARLALHIRDTVRSLEIPHLASEFVQFRIGVHSGPVAAGVVGTVNPRYCLFGDTVNVASRMESSGEAMKIQISEDSAQLLQAYAKDEFRIQYRGTIPIKGKGEMGTHFLERNV